MARAVWSATGGSAVGVGVGEGLGVGLGDGMGLGEGEGGGGLAWSVNCPQGLGGWLMQMV